MSSVPLGGTSNAPIAVFRARVQTPGSAVHDEPPPVEEWRIRRRTRRREVEVVVHEDVVTPNLPVGHRRDDVAEVRIRTNAIDDRIQVVPPRVLFHVPIGVEHAQAHARRERVLDARAVPDVLHELVVANHVFRRRTTRLSARPGSG